LDKHLFKKLKLSSFAFSSFQLLEFVIEHYNQQFQDFLCQNRNLLSISNAQVLYRFLVYSSPIPKSHRRFTIIIPQGNKDCLKLVQEHNFKYVVQMKHRIRNPLLWTKFIRDHVDSTLLKSIEQGNIEFIQHYFKMFENRLDYIKDLIIGSYKFNQNDILFYLINEHTHHLSNDSLDAIYVLLLELSFSRIDSTEIMEYFYKGIKNRETRINIILPYIGKVFKLLSESKRETKEHVIRLVEFIKNKYILEGSPVIENSTLFNKWELMFLQDQLFFFKINFRVKFQLIELKKLLLKSALDKGSLPIAKRSLSNLLWMN